MGKPKLMLSSPMRAIMISLKPMRQCIPYSTKQQHVVVSESEDEDEEEEEEEEEMKKPLIISNNKRLFFSPSTTKSIMEEARSRTVISYRDSVVAVVASADPHADFMASMEEMVEAHGMRRWEQLLELLQCYLSLNEEKDHSAIAMAFVDLLPLVIGSHPR